MGFDVLYFPPIHPIGRSHRKGRNNSLTAEPGDPGQSICDRRRRGRPRGGASAARRHRARFAACWRRPRTTVWRWRSTSRCSARAIIRGCASIQDGSAWRADGSIRYAENPPKKYEDIVNFDFYAKDAKPALWLALRDVVQCWVDEGVRIFRVDNPHTKPLPFWQWLIADIRARHPDVIFLAEAFTRPAMMYRLAKIGFSQSYTYFTWRNSKRELTEYFTELTTQAAEGFLPPASVRQHAGHQSAVPADLGTRRVSDPRRAGRDAVGAVGTLQRLRAVRVARRCRAARSTWIPRNTRSGQRDWQAPGNIIAEISRLNHIRRRIRRCKRT